MKKNLFLLLTAFSVFTAGCALTPEYTRPASPVLGEWPSGPAYHDAAVDGAAVVPDLRWQDFITDEKLQKLIQTALTNNRDLRTAALHAERARALYGIQSAEVMPSLNAVGRLNRERVPIGLSNTESRMTSELYSVNLGVSYWELDFFGRIRSLKDRALEEYLATEEARRSAHILLVSGVANVYLSLAAALENLGLAETTLDTQKHAYNLIKRRYELGLASELDLNRAQAQVDAAHVDIARFTQLAAQDENLLNFLVGSSSPLPSELLPRDLENVIPPREISPGLSSEVLLNRPDIMAAEHRLKAANAHIGAARAAFFPRISLTAGIGTASTELSGLFSSGTRMWSFVPQIVMPIFDARLWSAHDAARVEREIAVAQYEKSIQSAFREVADALAAAGTVNRRETAQQSLVNSIERALHLSNKRYDKGLDSYLSVLDAQRSLYAAEQGLIAIRLARLASQVRLYAVLGGGGD